MNIRIVLTGRSYHLAESVPDALELPEGATLRDAVNFIDQQLSQQRDQGGLPASCLISLGGQHLGRVGDCPDQPLQDGDELMLIAPVAGG